MGGDQPNPPAIEKIGKTLLSDDTRAPIHPA